MRATDNKTRENIISAMQRKEKRHTIAQRLNVSISTIDKIWHKFKTTRTYLPTPYKGRKNTLTQKQEEDIKTKIHQTPDITLLELIDELALDLTESGLSRHLKKMDLTFKKRLTMQTTKNDPMSSKNAPNDAKYKKP
ncbi:MAG: hypothetical protein LBQ98_00630 [Nitrososphaerota archaeon]|nr:hypothetical protein [Nitrososphaerota archaeon]